MNINIVKSHCNKMDLLGEGKYGSVYKLHFKHKNLISRLKCSFCSKYYNKNIAIKQIILDNDADSTEDLEVESFIHKKCYSNNPDFFLQVYDFWIENSKYSLTKDYAISKNMGFFTLEYMNQNNLNCYLKKINNPNHTYDRFLNIQASVLFIIYIIDFLHNNLNICHGDISWNNVFIHDTGNPYMIQEVSIQGKLYQIPTNGFVIKIGDFSVTENIDYPNNKFIKRDYIVLDQLYVNYVYWRNLTDYNTGRVIKKFLKRELSDLFYQDPQYKYDYEKFWNRESEFIDEANLYYQKPTNMLTKYIELFDDSESEYENDECENENKYQNIEIAEDE